MCNVKLAEDIQDKNKKVDSTRDNPNVIQKVMRINSARCELIAIPKQ